MTTIMESRRSPIENAAPGAHYICDYRGVVANAPLLQALRELKNELEQWSDRHLYPQMRLFLRAGYTTQPGRFQLECNELEKVYHGATIKQTLNCLANAAAGCSEILIFTDAEWRRQEL